MSYNEFFCEHCLSGLFRPYVFFVVQCFLFYRTGAWNPESLHVSRHVSNGSCLRWQIPNWRLANNDLRSGKYDQDRFRWMPLTSGFSLRSNKVFQTSLMVPMHFYKWKWERRWRWCACIYFHLPWRSECESCSLVSDPDGVWKWPEGDEKHLETNHLK